MATPKPRTVFDDPSAHLQFLAAASDVDFEGQHFDRKEACRARADGNVAGSDLKKLTEQITECISAFSNKNRDGGLLVLGISSTGEFRGLAHLTEAQANDLLRLDTKLVHHRCESKLFEIRNSEGRQDHVALLFAHYVDNAICAEVGANPRAWTRAGRQNLILHDTDKERIRREKRIVDFERTSCCSFQDADLDQGVVKTFAQTFLEASSYHYTDRDVLYHAGGTVREDGRPDQFNHAGLLFFSGNPQRVLPHAHIRLLRFDAPFSKRGERPLPTHEQKFAGPVTKQIRDFRTFIAESAFFKTYQFRDPAGGFREEPEYPLIAIDEAIVNAIAHRDYAVQTPIQCEKYLDALVVRSPGPLRQQRDVPSHFSLDNTFLEHLPRNALLIEWLKSIRDAKDGPYVRALQEGTRRMRDEMHALGLPSPEYEITPLFTEVVLRNEFERREASLGSADIPTTEFMNLYPITPGLPGAGRDDRRRSVLRALADRLQANGWFIDAFRFGVVTAHRRGAARSAPEAVSRIVRVYPAYTFQLREYLGRSYLVIDATVVVQSVLKASQAIAQFGAAEISGLQATVDWRGWQRAKILASDAEFCRVLLHEYDREESIPSVKVFPKLTRKLIDQALAKLGVRYDLPREIKHAALSLEANAARIRAERTQALAEELAQDTFPLQVDGIKIGLSTAPLSLSSRGDGASAMLVDGLAEPEVEFALNRSSSDIRDGIVRYGSFEHQPRDVEIVPICAPDQFANMRSLIERLRSGKFKYKGAERTFSTKLAYNAVITADPAQAESECRRLLEHHPTWVGDNRLPRLFLVHCPEQGHAIDDEAAPYYRIKRFLLENGVPCQMVDTPTLVNPDYKDLNLALNIVAKCGLAPWVLPESIPDADFFVGLSYTQSSRGRGERLMGFANVFNEYGRWEFYSGGTHTFSFDERTVHYEALVQGTLERLTLSESPTVCFHYTAKFSKEDRLAILRAAKRVRPNGRYAFVWINTQHHVRLYDARPETDGSVARGRYVVAGKNQIYLSTTGYNPYRRTIGTPHVLELTARLEMPGDTSAAQPDLRVLAMQVLSLTKLNWASTDSLCAEPITTKYAGDIAYLTAAFMRQGGDFHLHQALEHTPWFI